VLPETLGQNNKEMKGKICSQICRWI